MNYHGSSPRTTTTPGGLRKPPGGSSDLPGSAVELLKPAAVAKLLGISTKTLARLPIRRLKLGPRTVRYRRDWIADYIETEAA